MTQITIDDSLSKQLGQIAHTVEILNSAGLSLGHFVPAFKPHPEDNCPYSLEELARMRSGKGGRTLSEIWKSLGVK
ncbi:MAG TPA: hypothetical protein VF175_12420 [Lacipirellula sp.]